MSKRAEAAAMKACPEEIYEDDSWTDDLNKYQREGFIKGYEQAEKDLVLTWENVRVIDNLIHKVELELNQYGTQQVYEEVIRRFKEAKK